MKSKLEKCGEREEYFLKGTRERLSIRLKAAFAGREGSASGSRSVPMNRAIGHEVRSREPAENMHRDTRTGRRRAYSRQIRRRALNALRERLARGSL